MRTAARSMQHRAAATVRASFPTRTWWPGPSCARIEKVPALNDAFSAAATNRCAFTRGHVNLGLAVDVAGKDGARSLKVPSIKNAEAMSFAEFLAAYDDIVARARGNKLTVADFEGTTISLTNPGTVGTVGSDPATDAGTRRDHRHRRHRLSAGISRHAGRRARFAWASAK